MLCALPAHAECLFSGGPAAYVNCIYDEVRDLGAEVLRVAADLVATDEAITANAAAIDALAVDLQLGRERCLLRSLRYQAVCAALAGDDWTMYATVSPNSSATAEGSNGDDICGSYVGNNDMTDWSCLAVPFVYYSEDGSDVRPMWSGCDVDRGGVFDEYDWFDNMGCTGGVPTMRRRFRP